MNTLTIFLYLYNLTLSQRHFTIQASISQLMYASVCMLCMICMILMGLLCSRVMIIAWSVRMRVLHQPLVDLSIGCFEVGTSSVITSDG